MRRECQGMAHQGTKWIWVTARVVAVAVLLVVASGIFVLLKHTKPTPGRNEGIARG